MEITICAFCKKVQGLKRPCGGFHHQLIQSLTFFAISRSGLLMALRALRCLLSYLGERCFRSIGNEGSRKRQILSCLAPCIFFLATLAGFLSFVYLTVFLPTETGEFPTVGFILAIINSLFILAIKILAIFVHRLEIWRLSAWI